MFRERYISRVLLPFLVESMTKLQRIVPDYTGTAEGLGQRNLLTRGWLAAVAVAQLQCQDRNLFLRSA